MPDPSLLLDRIENARFESGRGITRLYRSFVALDIDTSVKAVTLVRVLSIVGMPQVNELLQGTAFTRVSRHVVEPISGTVARGVIIYEGPRSEGFDAIAPFIVEKSSSLTQRPIQEFLLGNSWVPIQVRRDRFVTSTAIAFPISTKTDIKTSSVNALMPMVVVTLTRSQAPYPTNRPKLGTVNATSMPHAPPYDDTPAANVGFWLFAGSDLVTSNGGISYTEKCSLISPVTHDWSDLVYLREPNGENVIVPAATMDALLKLGYTNTLVQGTNAGQNAGVAKVGVYPLADFSVWGTHNLNGLQPPDPG